MLLLGPRSNNRMVVVVATVCSAVAALLVASVAASCVRGRRRARRAGSITVGDTSVQIDQLKEYTYDELKKATGNFCKDAELGRGAFGVVYKVSSVLVCYNKV